MPQETPQQAENRLRFKTIDTRTLKGLKQAERLKENGWQIGSIGFWTIQFYK